MRRTRKNTGWRPEIDQALLRLASTDAKFPMIAIQLNAVFGTTFTTNAVIGRFHRAFGAKTSRRTRSAEEIAEAKRNPEPQPRPARIEPDRPAAIQVEPASIPRPSRVQAPTAFEKISEGLNEALAIARGQAKPASGPASGPVTLIERRPGQCCWPVNDGGPYLFCGAPKRDPRSERDTSYLDYCDLHFGKMIVKPRYRVAEAQP